ncbi:hypothetical protein NNH03_14160, partial [Enterococcus faecium]|nr:hypothetical protein [Enterococcus faecium]
EGTARSTLRTVFLTSGQDSRGWWIRMVDKFIGLASRKQPGVINVEVLTRGWSDLFSDNHKFINSNWDVWLVYVIPELELSRFGLEFENRCL